MHYKTSSRENYEKVWKSLKIHSIFARNYDQSLALKVF